MVLEGVPVGVTDLVEVCVFEVVPEGVPVAERVDV